MKITIITVSYNAEETIADTLRSVSSQTYGDIEHILIDGASRDSTVAIVKKLGTHLSKFISEPDRGIYDAMNKGIGLASGDIVGFLNADDFYASQDALEKIATAFNASEVDACYGDLLYVRKSNPSSVVRYWRSCDYVTGAFRTGWCPPHPTFFVRRKIYEEYGCFNLRYKIAADVEMMFRLLELSGIKSTYIPETIIKMRTGGESNKSVANVILQNKEIVRFINESTDGKLSLVDFLSRKFVSRISQFVTRPRGEKG